ncbi:MULTISPECIES: PucR family transcriptional regulator [Tsukamurella]|uniref:PucR family transcriptional regulator n=2 Tax=Tsukamurella TaxID=2060 RepID=A0A5C5S510_9ACTN|nr:MULTISPECIES: helix-turn-helix domain-containing protein [Tsukamurella]NMD55467.1 hypothetical protein [Tsukamurella columbiensis]TWS30586.1 hypothetical protein FK530_01555 [Tsukamurella conjunctivitidis]
MTDLSPPALRWLTDFARAAENEEALDRMVREVDAAIIAALPDLAEPVLRGELDASTRAHWRGVLGTALREQLTVAPTDETHDLARTMARRGFPVTDLIAVYRVGQNEAWNVLIAALGSGITDLEVRAEVLLYFWPRVTHWLDISIEAMISTFTAEREQWQQGALARRTATIDALLAGRAVDVAEATAALGYPLARPHVAYSVWVDEDVPEAEVHRLLERSAQAVHRAVGGEHQLTQRSGARSLRCWSAGAELAPLVELPALPDGVRCAVGTPHPGPAGFRRSHDEAAAALAVGFRTGRPRVAYRDVELACLVSGDAGPAGVATLVDRELGALAEPGDGAARLRETLLAYLEAGGDARATGKALTLHPNTVRYRVRQAESLLGHPIDERRVYVELALHAVQVFGPSPGAERP